MLRIAFVLIGLSVSASAYAESAPKAECGDATKLRNAAVAAHGQWTVVTPGQFNFIQGIWSQHRELPGDLPPGDSAALLVFPGEPVGEILILKTAPKPEPKKVAQPTMVCGGMPMPKALIDVLMRIPTGPIDAATGEEM